MKLIIQVPCYNEEKTLTEVVRGLPEELAGVDQIEYLVIDDGSSDRTAEVACELGVHHVLELGVNRGLATAFLQGIRRSVELGADIIVNTDGDNQYKGRCIKDLIAPILDGSADIVVGTRPIEQIEHFSWSKKRLQRLGSWVVRRFSNTEVPDTTSGFRAYAADAATRLHVFNRYTYTLETIIQAGHMDMHIAHVPIEVNAKTRESRLISSVRRYIWNSIAVIIQSYVIYRPIRTFLYLSLLPGLLALGICVRFLYFFFTREGAGHVQSLILAAILVFIVGILLALGVLGALLGANRQLIEDCLSMLHAEAGKRENPPRKP